VDLLAKLLRGRDMAPEREALLQRCIENLRTQHAVANSLQLLQRILALYPNRRRSWVSFGGGSSERSLTAVIEGLDKQHRLLDCFFDEIKAFQLTARQAQGTATPAGGEDHVHSGPEQPAPPRTAPFHDPGTEATPQQMTRQVQARLGFLTFLLSHSSLALGERQVEVLWDGLVDRAVTPACEDAALDWFTQACADFGAGVRPSTSPAATGEPTDEGDGVGSMSVLGDGVLQHLFHKKLRKLMMHRQQLTSTCSCSW